MNKHFILTLVFIFTCSLFINANEQNKHLSNFNFTFNNNFNLQKQMTRYSSHHNNYGKVASDNEEIESDTFHKFRCFRDACIGMTVPGTILGSSAIIVDVILNAVGTNGTFDSILYFESLAELLPGFYVSLGLGIVSSIFLVCAVAFGISAACLYHKWTKNKGLWSYNELCNDEPSMKQGFKILL